MKILLNAALAILTICSGSAQGYFNASNNFTPLGASQKAFVLDGRTGLPLSKDVGRVQIINAADGLTLSPNGDAGVALTLDGLFFINGLVGGLVGGSANVIVRAWDSSTGATWADAACRSAPNSGLVTVTGLGGGTKPAATFAYESNFRGLDVCAIPEPSSIALAALGFGGLVVCWQRR